jgi:formylglycine-generating enzyme required for sulfatase activity
MKKILILEANPKGDLALNQEIRDLKKVVERSRDHEDLQVEIGLAVRPRDLQELMLDVEPHIVHFSGHGTGNQGLMLVDDGGRERLVSTEALSGLFELFANRVECVVLNACYSEVQANAITQHINYVVGMQQEIRDDAAIAFAIGFYRALGKGRSIEEAYKFGRNAIQIEIAQTPNIANQSEDRKFVLVDDNPPISQSIVIPEHLKPILKIRADRSSQQHLNIPETRPKSEPLVEQRPEKPLPKPQTKICEFDTATITEVETLDSTNPQKTYDISYQHRQAESFSESLGGISLEMVMIPAGQFLMGSPEDELERSPAEGPQHPVTLGSFFMSKFLITQAQWRVVASLPQVNRGLNDSPAEFRGNQRPVERVSWVQVVEFCARLSQKLGRLYRLPSESEWEYACRAGTTTPFYTGETLTTELANFNGTHVYGAGAKGQYQEQTTDVNSFSPNAFGLYDMHGNLCEWCADGWHDSYEDAPDDGSVWLTETESLRLMRNGSWSHKPSFCRSAHRTRNSMDYRSNCLGFRIVTVLINGLD